MQFPPVDNVAQADPHIFSSNPLPLTNAVQSHINKLNASDLPASSVAALAYILDPLENFNVVLLFYTNLCTFNHYGTLSYIIFTFSISFLATFYLLAITTMVLSLLNIINHNEYPAIRVDIPSCLDFNIILYLWFCISFKVFY